MKPPPEHTQKPDRQTKATVAEENPRNRVPQWPWRGEQQRVDSRMTTPAGSSLNLKGNTVVSVRSKHRIKFLCVKFPSCFYESFTPEGPVHKKICINYAESPMVSQLVERLYAGPLDMPFTRLSDGLSWGLLFFFFSKSLAKRWLQSSLTQFPPRAASKPLQIGS